METSIQIFNNPQFGEVRVTEIDGKTYFVGSDVAKSLGYKDPNDAILTHCKSGDTAKYSTAYIPHSNGVGGTNVVIINESNVYRLIMHSQLPEAEKFQDWVCDEVLPSIRRTGGYIAAKAEETPEEIMARALLVAQDTINRQKQRVQILEGENEHLTGEVKQLAPKAEYTDKVLQSTSTRTMTQVAKEIGMSAIALEKKLHDAGVIFKQSGQWLLYAKYQGMGYASPRTHCYPQSDGTVGTNTITVWTEKGRQFIHRMFENR
jgi:prophage antirepressor-like protein